ncbi:MAG TPA: type II toxin-antitoxin system VapC family toxin [Vicinamibacteria bacterium]|nr:type II toxin-antitoxin system VapC family toxin [Vicinamibacteria bacterium]
MNLYAESSAVLCWLLDEARATEVRAPLGAAELVLASSLTLIECDRVLIRAVAMKLLPEAMAAERRAVLARTADHWVVFDLDAEVTDRARRPFPAEPIRTLDAIHLATAVLARAMVPDLALLSLDERVRGSAEQMGFRIVPE